LAQHCEKASVRRLQYTFISSPRVVVTRLTATAVLMRIRSAAYCIDTPSKPAVHHLFVPTRNLMARKLVHLDWARRKECPFIEKFDRFSSPSYSRLKSATFRLDNLKWCKP